LPKLGTGLVILSLFFGLFGWTAAEAAGPTTCTGGVIAPGTYTSLLITGACSIPTGLVTVTKSVEIAPNASLNAAMTSGGTLVVGGSIEVERKAILLLGCNFEVGCTETATSDVVTGSIVADDALSVILHANSIGGNVRISGGGGGVTCAPNAALDAILLGPAPAYDDVSRNTIGGDVTVADVDSCWLGVIGNTVTEDVTVRDNEFADSDAPDIVSNLIGKNLACSANVPVPDNDGYANTVTGLKLGQCVGL